MITSEAIKSRAKALGFNLCGIAPATTLPELARLRDWLDRGYAGEMLYLHKSANARGDIRNFLPTARSVIVTATMYYAEPGETTAMPSERDTTEVAHLPAKIARYAWGEDYHVVLAQRLEALVEWMREQHDGAFDASIFVDKHHVQERVFAKYAGLGWIGKNTCVINREIGSWIFLAGIAVSLELPADAVQPDQCGACSLCIDSCPTGAIVDEYELDATKCISYLTIELDGSVPEAQRAGIADHVFGCDICQEVCPWNLTPLATLDPVWQPRASRADADARELWNASDFELHDLIQRSAMTRTTVSRLRRNLAVVLGNSGNAGTADVLDRPGRGVRRAAPSATIPLVQEHVEWAREKLAAHGPRPTGGRRLLP